MIYFDTDFLIHYYVIQDRKKHQLVTKIFEKSINNQATFISLLNVQEIAFVLSKLNINPIQIIENLQDLYQFRPSNYTIQEFKRASEICQKVGFQNINDCIHTAIAENHCTEFYTFNQTDFRQIKNYTDLKINILMV